MKTLEETLAELSGMIDRPLLEKYIARAWVYPTYQEKLYYFHDIDIARIRLIRMLEQEMEVGVDAMDIILSLLDQLYSAHHDLHLLNEALKYQQLSNDYLS